jgi:hypothetical protein
MKLTHVNLTGLIVSTILIGAVMVLLSVVSNAMEVLAVLLVVISDLLLVGAILLASDAYIILAIVSVLVGAGVATLIMLWSVVSNAMPP